MQMCLGAIGRPALLFWPCNKAKNILRMLADGALPSLVQIAAENAEEFLGWMSVLKKAARITFAVPVEDESGFAPSSSVHATIAPAGPAGPTAVAAAHSVARPVCIYVCICLLYVCGRVRVCICMYVLTLCVRVRVRVCAHGVRVCAHADVTAGSQCKCNHAESSPRAPAPPNDDLPSQRQDQGPQARCPCAVACCPCGYQR